MSVSKKTESKDESAAKAETPAPTQTPSETTAVGGLAELQAETDKTAAKGYLGSKEKIE